jgi:hypothetical protein
MLCLFKPCTGLSSREPRQQPLDHESWFLNPRDDVLEWAFTSPNRLQRSSDTEIQKGGSHGHENGV